MPEGSVHHAATGPWRRRTASGVMATAMALGLRHGLEETADDQDGVVVVATGERRDPEAALELYFDSRAPEHTWAVARPWLLPGRRW